MVYNHLEEEHLQDDNHSNFIVVKGEANTVSTSKDCPCNDNQGRDQEHQQRNNETMLFSLCGLLFLFVCYGLYLLFK